MRRLTDEARVRELMARLGALDVGETRVYFTGGVTAVLLGWRSSTIDVDLTIVPESDALLRAVPALKEELEINVELAAPSHFIPELPGWADRSLFIAREGRVSFYHYDPYSQALSKIERDHEKDRGDVAAMLDREIIEPGKLRELFDAIEPQLYRYPAINPSSFRRALDRTLSGR
ncbi:MAG: hypothetical protein HY049_12175 [Acidobacteria bacterium]|nr:hypothetical protein [Acidobacteriota bacterium]